tara:strand:+ start:355 stop:744 length:390 start_codon:yes stop_codon:yes gene_type:complete
VILDLLSVLIGFYLAKFLYEYLLRNDIISKDYEFIIFLGLVLCIQILHDFSFYFLVIKNAKKGINKVIDEFIHYAESVKVGAVIGDSFMYLLATPTLFYIAQFTNDINVFISIACLYLIGYFVYQKPKY